MTSGLSARDFVLSLLDSSRDGTLRVQYLVKTGALFDLDANAIRVTLARLVKKGVLAQIGRGQYGPGDAGRPMYDRLAGWQGTEDKTRPWSGSWLAAHLGGLPRGKATEVRGRERALRLSGFAELVPTLWVRPDNLDTNPRQLRESLVALGLDAAATLLLVADIAPAERLVPTSLWDTRALADGYRRSLAELDASARRLDELALADAARESLQVGRAVTGEILRDPLLPEEMVDVGLRRRLLAKMVDYNRSARRKWAELAAS